MVKHLNTCKEKREFDQMQAKLKENKCVRLETELETDDFELLPGGARILAEMDTYMRKKKYNEKNRTQYLNKVKNHLVPFFENFYAKNKFPFLMDTLLFALEAGTKIPPICEYLVNEDMEPGKSKTSIQAYKVLCQSISASVSQR